MNKIFLWMLVLGLAAQVAAGTGVVVVREKASTLRRVISPVSNTFSPGVADWLKDYVLPDRDAKRLQGLKLTAYVLDSHGARSHRYDVFPYAWDKDKITVTIRPLNYHRVWRAHELGGVAEIVVVGKPER